MQDLTFLGLLLIQLPIVWTHYPDGGDNCPGNPYRCGSDRDCRSKGQVCCGTRCGPVCRDRRDCITCANVRCGQGYICVETPYGPQCVPHRVNRPQPPPQTLPIPVTKPGQCPSGRQGQGTLSSYGNARSSGNTGPYGNTGQYGNTGPYGNTGQYGNTGPYGNTGQYGNTGPYGNTGGGGDVGICAFLCRRDGDCRGDLKCCPTACGGTTCVRPVHTPTRPPRPTCDDVKCSFGQKCVLEDVVCVRAPCYPQPKCVSSIGLKFGGFPWF